MRWLGPVQVQTVPLRRKVDAPAALGSGDALDVGQVFEYAGEAICMLLRTPPVPPDVEDPNEAVRSSCSPLAWVRPALFTKVLTNTPCSY